MEKWIKIISITLISIVVTISAAFYIFENQLFFWDKFVLKIENKTEVEIPYMLAERFGEQNFALEKVCEDDGKTIKKDKTYKKSIVDNYMNHLERFDLSSFNIYVYYMDPNTFEEIGTSNILSINAEYGKSYTIVVNGNSTDGLHLELIE